MFPKISLTEVLMLKRLTGCHTCHWAPKSTKNVVGKNKDTVI